MGWWENIDGYLVGDPTADVMGEALEPFEASPVAVAELLHLLNAAVRAEQTSLHDSRALDYGPICARLTDGTRIEPKATRDDPSAVEALRAGVRAVGSIFEGQFHRKPSLGELLATLDFVLDLDKHLADSGAKPDRFETKLELPAELATPPPTESKRDPPFQREPGPFYVFIEVVGHNPALVRGTFAALTKIPIADTPAIFEKRPPLLVVRDMSERAAARARLALEAAGALVHVREGDPAEDPELNPPPKQFPTTGSYLVLESGRSNPRLITALRELGGGLDLRTTISIVMEAPSLIPAPAAKTDEEEQRAQALCDEIEAAGGKVRLVGNWHDLA